MREKEYPIDDALLKHVAPIHWNHINLTGDYAWKRLCRDKDVTTKQSNGIRMGYLTKE